MKVKNTIPLPVSHLIDYQADDFNLIMLGAHQQYVDLISIDPETMGIISRYPVETEIAYQFKSAIDDSCIYLPTKLGQILALDKFSGQILTTINIALPIVSDIIEDEHNVYCVCGIPISKRWNLLVDNFCLCIFDKENGMKKSQSSYFSGTPCFICVNEEVWVVAGSYVLKYSKEGELIQQAHIGVLMSHPPIITEKFVILIAENGIVRILNRNDLSFYAIIRASNCPFKPIYHKEELIWFTENGVCRVDYRNQVYKEVKLNLNMNTSIELADNQIFGCDTNGSLIIFNLDSSEKILIKLSNDSLYQPIRVENYLFVASQMQLHQIEI